MIAISHQRLFESRPPAELAASLSLILVAFLLLRIITKPRNEPTTAMPSRMMITGMRIAHTRGG